MLIDVKSIDLDWTHVQIHYNIYMNKIVKSNVTSNKNSTNILYK